MRIQTFSIVAGTRVCNARCPFCVSKLTPANGVDIKPQPVNWRNFEKAKKFALANGVTTAFITSKGENTLFPDQVTAFLEHLQEFPIVELQTNGSRFLEPAFTVGGGYLEKWYALGLTTIAISVVHWEPERNRKIYFPSRPTYFDLPATIALLKRIGFTVRLSTVMLRDHLDTAEALEQFLAFARDNNVDQVTFRPVTNVSDSEAEDIRSWIQSHGLTRETIQTLADYITANGSLLLQLMHGAKVYDIRGQNVCFTNALTHSASEEEIRQIIFFPDGKLRYDWTHPGALIF